MPRLTNPQYLATHNQLRLLWDKRDGELFSYVAPQDQRDLHDYFRPCHDQTPEELLAHRKDVTAKFPSLPQRAGRALARFHEAAAAVAVKQLEEAKLPSQPAQRRAANERHLSVRLQLRPEPDRKLLAQAFLSMAMRMTAQQQKQAAEKRAQEQANQERGPAS